MRVDLFYIILPFFFSCYCVISHERGYHHSELHIQGEELFILTLIEIQLCKQCTHKQKKLFLDAGKEIDQPVCFLQSSVFSIPKVHVVAAKRWGIVVRSIRKGKEERINLIMLAEAKYCLTVISLYQRR